MDIITMARDVGKALQKDERYLNFSSAQTVADADTELQDMIGQFNLLKMEMQREVQKSDRDADKVKQLDNDIKELYNTIMSNTNMQNYNIAKKEVDDLIAFLQQIIVYSANGEDPDTVEPQSASCSGSCSGCAGCN